MKKSMSLLSAVVALAAAGYYVSDTPPAAAIEFSIALPDTTGCHVAADGLLIQEEGPFGRAIADTIYTMPGDSVAIYAPADLAGERRIRAVAFVFTPGGIRLGTLDCGAGADTAWGQWSNVFTTQPLPGVPGAPVARAVIR